MSKFGFLDTDDQLMAVVEGVAHFRTSWTYGGGSTIAMKIAGDIVARAEDVDGLRWIVEVAAVTVVDATRVARATLGDNGRSFAASVITSLES